MTEPTKPEVPSEPSNTKVAIGAIKTFLTTDGPIQFTNKMVMALGVAVAIGIAAGYFSRSHFQKKEAIADQVVKIDALKKNADQSAKNVHESAMKSADIDKAIAKGEAQAERTRQEVKKRMDAQKGNPNEDGSTGPRLDTGTVRLLNAHRAGSGLDATGGSNAEGRATAPAGGRP